MLAKQGCNLLCDSVPSLSVHAITKSVLRLTEGTFPTALFSVSFEK